MFAGAAREVVFSNPEVVRRINADFIPVALKAAQVNNPPQGVEGELYAEIGRSKPAPQGICVVNSAGKVLSWTLSFDDDDSIIKFLDYVAQRYKDFPDTKTAVPAQRFMRYPSQAMADVKDSGKVVAVPHHHLQNERCPARAPLRKGTLVGRVIGRALDSEGQLLVDTLRQEHYMESRFEIPTSVQERFAVAAAKAAGKPFRIPNELVRTLVSTAFLGQLDVDPLGNVPGSQNDSNQWEFTGCQVPSENSQSVQIRIDGTSHVEGSQQVSGRPGGDGRLWNHTVILDWEGYVDLKENRVTQLILAAQGKERLRWGNSRFQFGKEPDVAHLMAGHRIDLDCGVRYGLFAESSSANETIGRAVDK